jgi:hypothetical protein
MSKSTELKLVGQPIFSQVLKWIDKWEFDKLVKEQNSDRYYKSFKSWDHLVTMLSGILSRCDSMVETCEGLKGMSGKLVHMNLKKAPAKSSAGDGLRNWDNAFCGVVLSVNQAISAIFVGQPLGGLECKGIVYH